MDAVMGQILKFASFDNSVAIINPKL